MRQWLIGVLLSFLIVSCGNDSNFSGHGDKTASETSNQTSKNDSPTPKQDDKDSKASADATSEGTPEGGTTTSAPNPDSMSPAMPDNAITKGSFTAWADPKAPTPGQPYWIFIELKLPSDVTTYLATDISGRLTGSDGYSRGVGRDSKGPTDGLPLPAGINPSAIPQDKFEFFGSIAKIGIWVPGAAELVHDIITIRSDLLKESQTIAITFK